MLTLYWVWGDHKLMNQWEHDKSVKPCTHPCWLGPSMSAPQPHAVHGPVHVSHVGTLARDAARDFSLDALADRVRARPRACTVECVLAIRACTQAWCGHDFGSVFPRPSPSHVQADLALEAPNDFRFFIRSKVDSFMGRGSETWPIYAIFQEVHLAS